MPIIRQYSFNYIYKWFQYKSLSNIIRLNVTTGLTVLFSMSRSLIYKDHLSVFVRLFNSSAELQNQIQQSLDAPFSLH